MSGHECNCGKCGDNAPVKVTTTSTRQSRVDKLVDASASRRHANETSQVERCRGGGCKCCEVFGIAYGEALEEASAIALAATGDAYAAFIASGGAIANPTPRLVPLQEFNIAASKILGDAFIHSGINDKCCIGYSVAIKKGLIAIFSFTAVGIFNPYVPIGTGPSPPFIAGQSVYQNIAISLELMKGVVANAKAMSTCH